MNYKSEIDADTIAGRNRERKREKSSMKQKSHENDWKLNKAPNKSKRNGKIQNKKFKKKKE